MRSFNINITEDELNAIISSLLFSSSVNVIADSTEDYPVRFIEIAKKFKTYYPEIKLKHMQFIEEENYEEEWTKDLLQNFKPNLEITNFDNV